MLIHDFQAIPTAVYSSTVLLVYPEDHLLLFLLFLLLQAWDLTLARWQKLTTALAHYPTKEFPPIESSKASVIKKNHSGVYSTFATELLEVCLYERRYFVFLVFGVCAFSFASPSLILSIIFLMHLKIGANNQRLMLGKEMTFMLCLCRFTWLNGQI